MRKQIYSVVAVSGVLLFMLSIFNSCKKEETFAKATVETSQVSSISEATATCIGIITADGGSEVTARGFCWGTSPIPTIENDTTIAAGVTPDFSSSIKGLSPGTTYYVRAYAVNKGGVAYGLNATFTTKTYSVTTIPISIALITATSAIGGGNIVSDGDSSSLTVTARGVCWNTFPAPTIENRKTTDGVGGGRFSSSMDSLTVFTTYYVRAYATNGNGTIYGNEVSFTTQSGIIELTTDAVSTITLYTATSGGTISSDGGAAVTARGVCWNTSSAPTIDNLKTSDGSGSVTFTSSITGLTPGTTYYVRSYATNSFGTAYGNEVTLTTQSGVVGLTTAAASSIRATTATSGGTILSDGGAVATARGICWNTTSAPTVDNLKTANGIGTGTFTSSITGLSPGTTYYVRAYATNSIGTCYGAEISFTTQSGVIVLTTHAVSSMAYTATSGGTISSDGGTVVIERGVCWGTSSAPTIANSKTVNGSGIGSFTSNIAGLTTNTLYHIRSHATNSFGTAYGNEVSFTTTDSAVMDIDGNLYSIVKIGTQTWMAENLKTTKYNDGTDIPLVSDGTTWANLSSPGYCYLDNDITNKNKYGILYNWYTLNTGKLAPNGWHVSTDAEWKTLGNYLMANGYNYDGTTSGNKIAKSLAAKEGWRINSIIGAVGQDLTKNNRSGFAGLPGGYRDFDGLFNGIGQGGVWWCSTQYNSTINAYYRFLTYDYEYLSSGTNPKSNGFSVRCVRDN